MNTAARSYLSPLQADRIDRILEATRALLIEVGIEGITARKLAERSQVSPATLYNRFGSLDNVVTLAVIDHFEKSIQSLVRKGAASASPLQKAIHSLSVVDDEAQRGPAFASALMKTYYRLDPDRSMPDRLYRSLYQTWLPILEEMEAHKLIKPWYPLHRLCSELCDCEMNVMVNWSLKVVANEKLRDRLTFSILALLLGASVEPQAAEIETVLRDILPRIETGADNSTA